MKKTNSTLNWIVSILFLGFLTAAAYILSYFIDKGDMYMYGY